MVHSCSECFHLKKKHVQLLKKIVTSSGNQKCYPFLVYPYVSVTSSLQSLFLRPGFFRQCEHWRQDFSPDCSTRSDVYDGKLWKDFMCFEGRPFLGESNYIGLMLMLTGFNLSNTKYIPLV